MYTVVSDRLYLLIYIYNTSFSKTHTRMVVILLYTVTVEEGHSIIDLSTKDTGQGPINCFPYSSNTF